MKKCISQNFHIGKLYGKQFEKCKKSKIQGNFYLNFQSQYHFHARISLFLKKFCMQMFYFCLQKKKTWQDFLCQSKMKISIIS